MSAFGLAVPLGDDQGGELPSCVAEAMRAFLEDWPDARYRLEWRDAVTLRRPTPHVDVVLLRFAADGALEGLEPHLSGGETVPEHSARERVESAILEAYNTTRHLPEVQRPMALLRRARAALMHGGTGLESTLDRYLQRLVAACVVSIEPVDQSNPVERYRPPDFRSRRTLGCGVLSVVIRSSVDANALDVWMSAHHAGLDGVPLQDLLTALERRWGLAEEVAFPPPDSDEVFMSPRPCSAPAEREVHEMLTFVDMSPILAVRQSLNRRHQSEVGGPVTFGALLAWLLAREPEFAGVKVASTVDVAASDGYERDVDVVPLRPADFVTGSELWDGFVSFAREFNRLIGASRTRKSPLRGEMQTAGLLPAWAHLAVVRSNPAALDDTFGSLCVTIVKDAKVFVAPMTDLGLGHGFFAIGNTALPSVDGGTVTAVTVKGDAGRIDGHVRALRRVVERCRAEGVVSENSADST